VAVRNWQGYTLDGCVVNTGGEAFTLVRKGTKATVWEARLTKTGVAGGPSGKWDKDWDCI
jgi:hypothetical protein